MTDPLKISPPSTLLRTLLTTITTHIHPLSSPAMSEPGTKLFGAAILLKSDLSFVLAGTNHESASPLNHGETYTVSQFFTLPPSSRPNPKDCLFFSTHEPCSLCINAIVWSGFDNFVYLWDYGETDRLFGIPGDLDVWRDCFHDGVDGEGRKELYRRVNPRFVARSVGEVLRAVGDGAERRELEAEVEQVKRSYGSLSPTFVERTGLSDSMVSGEGT